MHSSTPNDPERHAALVFAREVPEIASGKVAIRALARAPGVRMKVAVVTDDPELDAIGACVGLEGSRIKRISAELGGEAVHVMWWSPYPDQMIRTALSPLRVTHVAVDEYFRRAVVTVPRNQDPRVLATLAGQRELAGRLCEWEIEIVLDPYAA